MSKKWYTPAADVYYTSTDGARTLIAKAGERISREQAIKLGIVKAQPQLGPKEHKS